MMTVINCIAREHNLWLVLLAALMCLAGSAVTIELFQRALATRGGQRFGWQFMTAVAAGSSIWSTHFIAMLGYEPGAPVSLDPILTIVSLLIAIAGTFCGFCFAAAGRSLAMPLVGGAAVGLAISAMHYTGMFAYRVEGLVEWDQSFIIASIAIAMLLAGVSLLYLRLVRLRHAKYLSIGLLVGAIVSLHFTAMAAFHVTPLNESVLATDTAAMQALALSIAIVGLIIVGAGLSSYLIDETMRADSYEQLQHMAWHDALTGLPNRAAFGDRLRREIEVAAKTGRQVALVALDLERFKEINDGWGHAAGDEVLRSLARRLDALVGEGEHVARVGGDEFAAIKLFREQSELLTFVSALAAVFDEPIPIREWEMTAGGSLGVAVYPSDARDAEGLVNNADMAMYRAKSSPTERTCFYDPHMGDVVRLRRTLAEDLRRAIEQEDLDVHYQVQTSVHHGTVVGYEALLRWTHPERGAIPPLEFIPIAEESGLILSLGEWVLRRACRDAARWNAPFKIAVNLSAVQLADGNLPKLVHEVLLETGLSANRLELELTESALIKDKVRSLHIIRQIKALGVKIALDDFGTAYSSLETLRTFPFDKIKLDRAFMHDIERDPQSKAIIRAVLALGKSLGIPVLAEGIETPDQMSILQAEGCDEAQGYLLGRALAVHQLGLGAWPPETPNLADLSVAGRELDSVISRTGGNRSGSINSG